ncbi:MAG TPA: zinc-ribbon domain containing protein [Chloroflexota bacterium]|jgi:CxxC-x17-CxxC domain-containing protein|nr:zinc-ribbon domain containing protein [Chloroflexota bacterium]
MSFQDRTLSCRDCGQQFVFTSGEQEFYQSRGLTNDPGRCPECRRARKPSSGNSGGGYAYSSSSDGFTGGDGGPRGYGGYDRPRREMFPATCSQCGKETKVPFQPRGDKPVYCSECFETVRASRGY